MRHSLQALALLLLGCAAGPLGPRASALRTVDPAEASLDDLEPLARWVGDARVVMLGESHGDGTSLLAMTRVVRFLHERLGFGVLAFESSFLDMEVLDEALGTGLSLTEVAERGLHAPWSEVAETRPLLAYLRSTRDTRQPLVACGFDLQRSGLRPDSPRVLALLGERLAAAGVAPGPEAAACLEEAVLHPTLEERPCLERETAGLLERLGRSTAGTALQRGWVEQALLAMQAEARMAAAFARARAAAPGPEALLETLRRDSPWVASARDEAMARHLAWLLEQRFPGRKVVVWAARTHASRHPLPDTALGRPVPTMGSRLSARLGGGLRSLALSWYDGRAGVPWLEAEASTAPDGSLEAQLHASGRPLWLVDTRAPWPEEPPGGLDGLGRWSESHDGVLFIDHMAPATWAEGAALRSPADAR